MKRDKKEKEQRLEIGKEKIKDREQKEEFKIELVKIGNLEDNTAGTVPDGPYDTPT